MDEDTSQSLASILVPVFTISLVLLVQVQFWFASSPETENKNEIDEPQPPTTSVKQAEEEAEELDNGAKQQPNDVDQQSEVENLATDELDNSSITPTQDNDVNKNVTTAHQNDDKEEDLFARTNQWRCVCEEGSFLPPALLKTFGPAEAMVRLGTGQCYHKQM
ncbi:MAG: hypothetical protein SGBAC_004766 [Bacillariaceae sp.]